MALLLTYLSAYLCYISHLKVINTCETTAQPETQSPNDGEHPAVWFIPSHPSFLPFS